jgi:HEAT repeat protein
MRLRVQRRVWKRIGQLRHGRKNFTLPQQIRDLQASGSTLRQALRQIATDQDGYNDAGRLLVELNDHTATSALLERFFKAESTEDIWNAATGLAHLNDHVAISKLINALNDPHHDRRSAAAHALGAMHPTEDRSVNALVRLVADSFQPVRAREEAAEALSWSPRAIPVLIAVLVDPSPVVRFWATYSLGSLHAWHPHETSIVPALESVLNDKGTPEGWWPVGLEALAFLGRERSRLNRYRDQARQEYQRIKADPNASDAERKWTECYSDLGAPSERKSMVQSKGV